MIGHRMTGRRGRVLAALLLIPALSLSGCGFYKKMQANKKNTEVEGKLAEIQAQEANRYLPDLFTAASKALNDSRASVEAGEYDQALSLGDQALGTIEQINGQLPQAKAIVQQKRQELTNVQNRIVNVVEQIKIIAPEETALVERSTGVEGQITQLQQAQVQVPDGEQGYNATLLVARAFLTEATSSLAAFEKDRAERLLGRIRDVWTRANELDVRKYVPEAERVPDEIAAAEALIASASFRAVLNQYTPLEQDITRYAEAARQARAEARIEQAERLIELAEQEPGASLDRIDDAKTAVDQAVTLLREGNYDNAYISADSAISTARTEVQALESSIADQVKQLEIRLEESLKWETPKIASEEYNQALTHLQAAKDALQEIRFSDSQTSIDAGNVSIEEAIGLARSVGLSIRLREAENALLASEDKGAYTYLQDEYRAIQTLITDASGEVEIGKYDEAETTVAEAENRTRGIEDGLRELAQARVDQAEARVEEAVTAEAGELAADELTEAREVLEESRNKAATGAWREAIEAGDQASERALAAAQAAYQIRGEELTPNAAAEIENARKAGAASYAADILNRAIDALEKSKTAAGSGDYKTALAEAQLAYDGAIEARRNQITKAQAAADSAIAAQAPDYDSARMAAALEALTQAKEKMEAADYAASLELARTAEQQALESETETWKIRASNAIAELTTRLSEADASRAPTYAKEEFQKATQTLSQASARFSASAFREGFELADQGKGEAEQVFAKLNDEVQLVRSEYNELVNLLKSFVQDDFGTQLHSEAVLRLGSLDDAILKNDLTRAFGLYEEGMDTVQKQTVAVKLHNVNAQKEVLTAQIAEADQAGLFQFSNVSAESLRQELVKAEFDPVLDRLKPDANVYRETLRLLAQVESELARLREAAIANADIRVQKIRTDIDNAREIGARGLVPGVFDSAVDTYERARDMIYLLRTDLEGTQTVTFLTLGEQIRAAEAQAAALNQSAIGRRNSVDYMRDLILWSYDMTRFLDQWKPVESMGKEMILTAAPTSQIDSYDEFQTEIKARQLLLEAERLYERVRLVQPPAAEAAVHATAVRSFATFVRAADGFHKFGLYTRYPTRMRERFLAEAFATMEQLHMFNAELLLQILTQVRVYELNDFERDLSEELMAFGNYLRREKAAQ